MITEQNKYLYKVIRDVHDFPKKGVIFKDITPLLADKKAFSLAIHGIINLFKKEFSEQKVDKVLGIDARGFIFGAAIAYELKAGFVPVRKVGKLPYETKKISYSLEYGSAELEIHTDAIKPGERVLLIDDVLATGGTASAVVKILQDSKAELIGIGFLMEIGKLSGREKIDCDCEIKSLLYYDE